MIDYQIEKKGYKYTGHGMTLIDCDIPDRKCSQCKFSFLLYGGKNNIPFKSSFIKFNVVIDKLNKVKISQEEKMIDTTGKLGTNFNFYNFGYTSHCFTNNGNEKLLLLFTKPGFQILLYNVTCNIAIKLFTNLKYFPDPKQGRLFFQDLKNLFWIDAHEDHTFISRFDLTKIIQHTCIRIELAIVEMGSAIQIQLLNTFARIATAD